MYILLAHRKYGKYLVVNARVGISRARAILSVGLGLELIYT